MTRLALLLLLIPAQAAHGQSSYARAVVRVTSHGCSGVVIHTEPGRSLVLSCSHAWEGRDRNRPIVLDVPASSGGQAKRVQIRLAAVDYRADLSLIELNDGPLPYSVAVPGANYTPGRLVSAGYDQMRGLVAAPATAVRLTTLYTRERPVPGRSGGGLIDDRGQLCGLVQGYEVTPWRNGRGMYVDLPTIQTFLTRNGWKQETVRQPEPPSRPSWPPTRNPVPPVQGYQGHDGISYPAPQQRAAPAPQQPDQCLK